RVPLAAVRAAPAALGGGVPQLGRPAAREPRHVPPDDAFLAGGPPGLPVRGRARGGAVDPFAAATGDRMTTDHETETTDDETAAVTAATGPTGGRAMRRWSGVIAREGVQTGDGRVFAEGAIYWEGDGPWPLRWTPQDHGAHDGAVPVGTVETIERRDGGVIWASGTIDTDGEYGAEVVRLMEEGLLRGVSIDPDDWAVTVIDTTITEAELEEAEAELMAMLAAAGDPDPGTGPDAGAVLYEDEAGAIIERYTRARIRALTLVDIPAFADAEITLEPVDGDDESGPEAASEVDAGALVAAVVGSPDLPVADPAPPGPRRRLRGRGRRPGRRGRRLHRPPCRRPRHPLGRRRRRQPRLRALHRRRHRRPPVRRPSVPVARRRRRPDHPGRLPARVRRRHRRDAPHRPRRRVRHRRRPRGRRPRGRERRGQGPHPGPDLQPVRAARRGARRRRHRVPVRRRRRQRQRGHQRRRRRGRSGGGHGREQHP